MFINLIQKTDVFSFFLMPKLKYLINDEKIINTVITVQIKIIIKMTGFLQDLNKQRLQLY